MFQVDGDLGAADGKVDRVVVNTIDDTNESEQTSVSAFTGNVASSAPPSSS